MNIIKDLNTFLPTNDYVFKRIFGHVGNEIITQGLLNAILDTKVKKVDLDKNTILEQDIFDDKIGILDVKATLNDNVVCNIEMQMVNQTNIDRRLMFYWSEIYTSTIKQGNKYSALKKTIEILIANFEIKNLKLLPKGYTMWQLREKDFSKIVLTEVCEIHIIELPKWKKLVKNGQLEEKDLEKWTRFLLTPEELEEIDMENDEAIKKAKEEFETLKQNEKEQYLAELRMKHILDTNNMKKTGYRIGMEEGRKEGRKVGREEGRKEGEKEAKKKQKRNWHPLN